MKRHHYLPLEPEDLDRLNGEIELACDAAASNQEAAYLLEDIFHWQAADGDQQAERIHRVLAQGGGMVRVKTYNRKETGIFIDRESGKMLNVPKRANVPVFDENGVNTGLTQAPLWSEMSRPELRLWVLGQARQAETLRDKVRTFQRLDVLWERYPIAQTAGELCRMAGLDVEQLDMRFNVS